MAVPPYTLGWVYNLGSVPATSDARGIIALAVVFALVALLSVAFKIGIRLRTIGSVGWDDISIAFSSVRSGCALLSRRLTDLRLQAHEHRVQHNRYISFVTTANRDLEHLLT